MRDLVKKGKGAGVRFECDDCHKNDTGYDLTPAARDNFKKLLAAVETRK
jgi:transposase-like protein